MMVGSVEGGHLALGVFKTSEDLSSALHPCNNITRRMGLVSLKAPFAYLMCFGHSSILAERMVWVELFWGDTLLGIVGVLVPLIL